MNPCITAKKNGHDPFGCVRMAYCTGYGAFRKTSTADAVARSFLLTPDFAVGKSSFFRRFDEPHFCYAKTGFMNPCITAKKNGHDPYGCVRFWLRYRDSNPDRQSQRLQCYLYTISQYRARISSLYIILHLENLSRGINVKFQ